MAKLRSLLSLLIPGIVAFDVRQALRVPNLSIHALQASHERHQSDDEVNNPPRLRTTSDSDLDGKECSSKGLSPVLQSIVDERREFQMNLGRAMDTLRSDMQDILTKRPDFSIYHKDIRIVDPSGVQLQGLEKYKSAFAFFQTFISFWFHPRSGIQFRMVYDSCRSSIRISWNAVLVPKVPLGRPLYVDGISYYQMDSSTGLVVEHRIENLLINNTPVAPPYGILSLLQQDALRLLQPLGVPVGVGALVQEQPQ